MIEETKPSVPHPDDLIVVGVYFAFRAKLNPEIDDPMPLYAPEIEQTFGAAEAVDYLDEVTRAIRERRLCGFLYQENAETAVGARVWIARTTEEVIAEAQASDSPARLPNVQKIIVRRED